MPIQKVRRARLSDEVVKELKSLIQSGDYPPLSKLPPEKELAEQFGVSRVSIREALSILSAAKIIEIRHGEGSYVQDTNIESYLPPVAASLVAKHENILHLIEVRMALEVSTARFAAERATSVDLKEMEEACEGYLKEIESGAYGEASDIRFHQAVATATQNTVFLEIMRPLVELIRESMRFTLGKNVGHPERMHEVYAEHIRILAAIKNNEPDEAAREMHQHLSIVYEKVRGLISSNNLNE